MIETKVLVRNIALFMLFGGIAIYALSRGHTAIFGIDIAVSISDGQAFSEPLLTLTGNANHASRFTVNGREVLLDKDGNFSDPLLLQSGYSIIELHAEDHFGRAKNKLLHVYRAPSTAVEIAPPSENVS